MEVLEKLRKLIHQRSGHAHRIKQPTHSALGNCAGKLLTIRMVEEQGVFEQRQLLGGPVKDFVGSVAPSAYNNRSVNCNLFSKRDFDYFDLI